MRYEIEDATFNIADDELNSFEYFRRDRENQYGMAAELSGFMTRIGGRRLFYDVGALVGIFSLAFTAKTGGSAVAFEPSKHAYPRLVEHVRLNPGLSIRPEAKFIGSEHGRRVSCGFEWIHVFAEPFPGCGASDRFRQPCPTPDRGLVFDERDQMTETTLDVEIARTDASPPDALKIDVEGYEYEVLRGAERLLRVHRPLMFLEVHASMIGEYGKTVADIENLLSDYGYRTCNNVTGEEERMTEVFSRHKIGDARFFCEPLV